VVLRGETGVSESHKASGKMAKEKANLQPTHRHRHSHRYRHRHRHRYRHRHRQTSINKKRRVNNATARGDEGEGCLTI